MTGTIAWLSRTSQERGKGVEMGRRSLAIHKGLSQVSADWQDKVMHGSLTVGEQVLMGGDVAPDRYGATRRFGHAGGHPRTPLALSTQPGGSPA